MNKPRQARRSTAATSPPTSPRPRRRVPPSLGSSSSHSLFDRFVEDYSSHDVDGNNNNNSNNDGARFFSYRVKQQCWEKAEKVKGRDPERWRRDVLGNVVFRKLVGCPGCYCHDYDHIIPYSKGGQSTLENCQVLRASVNRSKGNKTEISKEELIQRSALLTPSCRVPSEREMDFMELSAYGNIRQGQGTGGCSIQ